MFKIKILKLSYVTETDEASIFFPLCVSEIWRLQMVVFCAFHIQRKYWPFYMLNFCNSGYGYAVNIHTCSLQSRLHSVLR